MEFQLINVRPSKLLNFSDQWVPEAKSYFEGFINEKGPFLCEVMNNSLAEWTDILYDIFLVLVGICSEIHSDRSR